MTRLPTAREQIIAYLASQPWAIEVNRTELAAQLGRPASTIRHVFSDLVKEGVIWCESGRPWRESGPTDPDHYRLAYGYKPKPGADTTIETTKEPR